MADATPSVELLLAKIDLLERDKQALLKQLYDERYASQQVALDKAFLASQLAIVHAREVSDAKIAALGGNQHDAIKWVAGVIGIVIAWALGHFQK